MTQLLLLCIGMYEDLKEYLNWYDTRRDTKFAADAPVIGLVLQRSHLVTGDEGHYSGVVSELEAQGAKVRIHFSSASALLILWLQKAQGVISYLGRLHLYVVLFGACCFEDLSSPGLFTSLFCVALVVLTVTAEPLAGPLSPLTAAPLCASHAKQQSVRASEQCNRTLSRAENKCQGV